MGTKAEARFTFITDKAEFASEDSLTFDAAYRAAFRGLDSDFRKDEAITDRANASAGARRQQIHARRRGRNTRACEVVAAGCRLSPSGGRTAHAVQGSACRGFPRADGPKSVLFGHFRQELPVLREISVRTVSGQLCPARNIISSATAYSCPTEFGESVRNALLPSRHQSSNSTRQLRV